MCDTSPMMNKGARRLERWLYDHRMSQRGLARLMGGRCAGPTVNAWVSGDSLPSVPAAVRLARLTGITVESWTLAPDPTPVDHRPGDV